MSGQSVVRYLHKALAGCKPRVGVILFDLRGGPFDGCRMPCRIEYASDVVSKAQGLFLPVNNDETLFACYTARKLGEAWFGQFDCYGRREQIEETRPE